jgi:shikimate kinase
MKQILYMLIGPKGAGKSHIGTLVNNHTDIHFLRVEPIWLSFESGEDGWRKVETAIDALFQKQDKVMIESLGAGEGFRAFYASLAKKYSIRLIRIKADLATCLRRVQNRNKTDHMPVSDDQVMEYNRIAAGVTYDWDLEIDNHGPAENEAILSAIMELDKRLSQDLHRSS